MSQVKLCFHTKLNGKRCQGFALAGKSYCRFHNRYYERHCITNADYELPVFEDSRSVVMSIHELVRSRMKGKVDNRDLTAYMYAYQVAASMMNRPDAMAPDVEEAYQRERTKPAASGTPRSSRNNEDAERDGVAEIFVDGINELLLEPARVEEALSKGLPAPEPLPIDRLRILQDFAKASPDFGTELLEFMQNRIRRFPGDQPPAEDEPALDECSEATEEIPQPEVKAQELAEQ